MNRLILSCAGAALAALVACGGGDPIELKIDELVPAEGPLGGGQMVTLTGEGFLAGGAAPNMAVFGESFTMAVSAISDTEVQIITPPGVEPGEVDVVIFNTNGYGIAAGAYTYVAAPEIDAIDPPSGHFSGGDEVTITGSGFVDEDAGQPLVTFDGKPAQVVEVVDDGEMVVVAPSGEPFAVVDVALSNNRGSAELADAYTYFILGLVAAGGGNRWCCQKHGAVYWVDVVTGTVFPRAPSDGLAVWGMSTNAEGEVYATMMTGVNLSRIDPQTGDKTIVGSIVTVGGDLSERIPDIEFHDGVLYGADINNGFLGTFNLANGEFTQLGAGGLTPRASPGANLVSDGDTLYHTRNGSVFVVDTADGTLTQIDGVLLAQPRISGLTYRDGAFYGVTRGGGGGKLWGAPPGTSTIWKIDLTGTGLAEYVATIPAPIHGLAVLP